MERRLKGSKPQHINRKDTEEMPWDEKSTETLTYLDLLYHKSTFETSGQHLIVGQLGDQLDPNVQITELSHPIL